MNDWTWFLQVGAGISVIADTLLWAGLHPLVINTTSWSLWFYCLPTIMISSAVTITCLIIPKPWSSLHWKASPATVAPNGMTVYLNLPISVLKVVKNDEASSRFWYQYPFLQSHTVIMQVSASKWAISSGVLKVVWFSCNCLVQIGWVQANVQLQVTWFVLVFYKHKTINPRCSFMDWFKHSCL